MMSYPIIEARVNRGLSIRQAAVLIGVSGPTLAKAEAGESLYPSSAKKIADFYGFRVTEIWPVLEPDADAVA